MPSQNFMFYNIFLSYPTLSISYSNVDDNFSVLDFNMKGFLKALLLATFVS